MTTPSPTPAALLRPGARIHYPAASEAMRTLARARANDEIDDVLVLVEHPPTFTAGRRSEAEHLRWTEERMRAMGAGFHHVDRGGSVTFHGPGQLVGYPIFKLDSRLEVLPHVRRMEEIVIRTGADLGVELTRSPRQTGVWSADGTAKVCAIGVRLDVAKVTTHGWGLNCDTDLSWFDAIVPCGVADRTVASLSTLAGRHLGIEDVAPLLLEHAGDVFERDFSAGDIPADLAGAFGAEPPSGASLVRSAVRA